MSDADIQVKLVPMFDKDSPAVLVGTIRNVLALERNEVKELTIEGIKDGFTIHGQYKGASFRWTIHENGESYLKAWGEPAAVTWEFLREEMQPCGGIWPPLRDGAKDAK